MKNKQKRCKPGGFGSVVRVSARGMKGCGFDLLSCSALVGGPGGGSQYFSLSFSLPPYSLPLSLKIMEKNTLLEGLKKRKDGKHAIVIDIINHDFHL